MGHEHFLNSTGRHEHFLNSTGRHEHFLNSTGRHWVFLNSTCKIRTPPPPSRAPIKLVEEHKQPVFIRPYVNIGRTKTYFSDFEETEDMFIEEFKVSIMFVLHANA